MAMNAPGGWSLRSAASPRSTSLANPYASMRCAKWDWSLVPPKDSERISVRSMTQGGDEVGAVDEAGNEEGDYVEN